jgi:hypothetical protein
MLVQIENMLDMMTLTSGLKTNSYRRVSKGQASSCHSEPKGWGPLRLYLFTLCIALCTTVHSDSHYNQLLPITLHNKSAIQNNHTDRGFLCFTTPITTIDYNHW